MESIDGGAGEDRLVPGENYRSQEFDFSETEIDNVEQIIGTERGHETIYGAENVQIYDGLGGNDCITGSSRADEISGGAGNDVLDGAGGDDMLHGGSGSDMASGGEGDDVYLFGLQDGQDQFDGGSGWTDVIEIETDAAGSDSPWTLTLDGESVEIDTESGTLDLDSDSSDVITLNGGSELEFQNVEQIQW